MAIADQKTQKLKISATYSESSSNEEYDGSEEKSGDSSQDEDIMMKNEGWADSIAKILSSSKPKNKKTIVLSRAKKLADVKKTEHITAPTFEIVGEKQEDTKPNTEESKTTDIVEPLLKRKKNDKPSIRVKPDILEKDRERLLTKIATKGVVQLFNAVRNQQKSLEKELNNDVTEGKKEKIMKKFDKRVFLDTLMGQTKSVVVDEVTKNVKDEIKLEEKPRWNALREDFMMGAKMKDWDKESMEE